MVLRAMADDPKNRKLAKGSEVARTLDFRGGRVAIPRIPTEVISQADFPGGADTVNKKFTNPGDAGPGTVVVDGGGSRVSPVHVSLIFWGDAWQNDPVQSTLTNAVAKVVTGRYLSALGQYGAATSGTVNRVLFDSSNPPSPTFTTADVASFVIGLIDDDKLPEPDADWQHLNVVMMPSTTRFAGGGSTTGLHTRVLWSDYDLFDVDNDQTHFAWVQYGPIDTMTATFSHELAEAVTDPEGNAIQIAPASPTNWNEIGDVCSSTLRVDGVVVQSYWSAADNACVIPIERITGMQWQSGIVILGVFAGVETQNAWIFFRNQLGVVGWRKILPSTADGCTNVLQIAIAAQQSGRQVQCLITNPGEIAAIQIL
jgi:hypothetical protein